MAGRGIDGIPIRWPAKYDPAFFEELFRETLALGDVRNAVGGVGVTVTGTSAEEATISASAEVQAIVDASILTVAASGVENARVLTAGAGVAFVDGGPGSTLTIIAGSAVAWGDIVGVPIYVETPDPPVWDFTVDTITVGSVGFATVADDIATGSLAGDLVLAPVAGRVFSPDTFEIDAAYLGITEAQFAALVAQSGPTARYVQARTGAVSVGVAASPGYTGVRVEELPATTALGNSVSIGTNSMYGFDGSVFAVGTQYVNASTEAWSGSARGTRMSFSVINIGTTTLTERLRITGPSGGAGRVEVADGTSTIPGLVGRNDTDTGYYWPGSNILGITIGGTHRAKWDASGRLLIGTDFTAINSGGGTVPLQVVGTSIGTSGQTQGRFSNDATGTTLNMLKSRGTTIGTLGIVQAGDSLGRVVWSADDGVDFTTIGISQEAIITGTPAAAAIAAEWVLNCNAGTSGASQLLRAGRWTNSTNEAFFRLIGNSNDSGTIDRTTAGLELLATTIPNNGLFPAIKWISADTSLTSNNPRLVAFIGAVSTQAYDDDNDGGARIVFGSHANDPGTGVPATYAFMDPAEFEFNTTLFDINAAVDISSTLLVGGAVTGVGTSGAVLNGWTFNATSTNPGYAWNETDAAADAKAWDLRAAGGILTGTIWNDAYSASADWLRVLRTTTTADEIELNATLFDLNGNLDVSGTALFAGVTSFTGNGVSSGARLVSASAFLYFDDTDAGADESLWAWGINSNQFRLFTIADAAPGTPVVTAINVQRSGTSVTEIELNATALDFNATLDVSGTSLLTGIVTLGARIRTVGYTVAALNALAGLTAGDRADATDALAPVFGAAVAGGGAVRVPVYYTGAAWFVG